MGGAKCDGGRKGAWLLVLLVILFTGAVRLRLLSFPLERDEGEFAYTGQLLLQGIPPYQLAYFMKLPGTHAAYALIMAVFGQTPSGIHLGLLIVNAVTIVMVFLLGRRLLGVEGGVIAAAIYGLLSTSQYVLGFQAHATHFVVLFALMGILGLYHGAERRGWAWFFASGLCFGLAFLMKQPGVWFMVFGAMLVVWSEVTASVRDWSRCLKRGAWYSAGAVLPYAITCLLMWRAGVFERFWFWTVTNVRSYGSLQTIGDGWGEFIWFFRLKYGFHLPLWGLGLIGLGWLGFGRRGDAAKPFILAFAAISFLATSMGLYYRPHYFVMMLPALGLLIAVAVISSGRWLKERYPQSRRGELPRLVLVTCLLVLVAGQAAFLFRLTPAEASELVYQDGSFFAESMKIAGLIKAQTAPGDRIAVLGSEPQLYFYSDRKSATGYIYMYDMMVPKKEVAQELQKDMIRQIEDARPEMIVFVKIHRTWDSKLKSDYTVWNWMYTYWPKYYDLTGIVEFPYENPPVYRFGKELEGNPAYKMGCVYLFKRKAKPPG